MSSEDRYPHLDFDFQKIREHWELKLGNVVLHSALNVKRLVQWPKTIVLVCPWNTPSGVVSTLPIYINRKRHYWLDQAHSTPLSLLTK